MLCRRLDELGHQREKKQDHLRIEQVGDQAIAERASGRDIGCAYRSRHVAEGDHAGAECLPAQEDEVGSAGNGDDGERGLAGSDQEREAEDSRERMESKTQVRARHRAEPSGQAAGERVADHQRGIRSGRDDDGSRGEQIGDEGGGIGHGGLALGAVDRGLRLEGFWGWWRL